MDIQISKHFHLSEFTASQTAERMGSPIVVVPGDGIFEALQALAVTILDPIREHFGVLVVSSGYRPPWLNAELPGTASLSQHTLGEAADFTCPGHTVEEVTRWIAEQSGLNFDQLIWEFDAWTHCSYKRAPATCRREVLTAKHGDRKTDYFPGLVPFTG